MVCALPDSGEFLWMALLRARGPCVQQLLPVYLQQPERGSCSSACCNSASGCFPNQGFPPLTICSQRGWSVGLLDSWQVCSHPQGCPHRGSDRQDHILVAADLTGVWAAAEHLTTGARPHCRDFAVLQPGLVGCTPASPPLVTTALQGCPSVTYSDRAALERNRLPGELRLW